MSVTEPSRDDVESQMATRDLFALRSDEAYVREMMAAYPTDNGHGVALAPDERAHLDDLQVFFASVHRVRLGLQRSHATSFSGLLVSHATGFRVTLQCVGCPSNLVAATRAALPDRAQLEVREVAVTLAELEVTKEALLVAASVISPDELRTIGVAPELNQVHIGLTGSVVPPHVQRVLAPLLRPYVRFLFGDDSGPR